MEDQQNIQIDDESNVFKYRKRSAYSHKSLKSKSSKQIPVLKIILFITIFFIVIGSLYKIVFISTSQKENETNKVKDQTQVDTVKQVEVSQPKNNNKDNKRIEELELRIQRLEQLVDKLQRQSKKESTPTITASNMSNLNSTALVEFMELRFSKQQTTINFLHMHDSQMYYYQKVDFLKSILNTDLLRTYEKAKISFMQALNNYKIPHPNVHIQKQIDDYLNKQKERLSREYDFNLEELPFCIVVPTLNNARNFRYQYNLQSMINLEYKNFKVVIVDDASTDHTFELIKLFIEENNISQNIIVLKNQKRLTAVPNIHRAITQHCGADDIVILADGDDELLGRYILKVFNHVYKKNKVDVVYSNHIQFYTHTKQAYRGWSMNYAEEEKKNNKYRDVPQRIAHLRSFKAKLYLKIKEEDLKDKNGEFLTSTYDQVICLPILEMSCGRIIYLQEFFYLYNFGIGTNDLQVDPVLQKNIADYVKFQKPKYQCVNE